MLLALPCAFEGEALSAAVHGADEVEAKSELVVGKGFAGFRGRGVGILETVRENAGLVIGLVSGGRLIATVVVALREGNDN